MILSYQARISGWRFVRKYGFCGNWQTSYAPGSSQKLLSHLRTYRFTRDCENARPGAPNTPARALLKPGHHHVYPVTMQTTTALPQRPVRRPLGTHRPTLEAWRQARNGIRKPTHDLREIFNAILYVNRTGIPWRYLPHDFPPHQTVYGYFTRWRSRRHLRPAHTASYAALVRQADGRTTEPSAASSTPRA